MKFKRTLAITLCAAIISITNINAQVTIGSGEKPSEGALLDLKMGSNGMATKGLGMPLVELTNLNPDTPAELSASIGGTGDWVLDNHVALVVYNTKEANRCATQPIYEGLYVFDGDEWQFHGEKGSEPISPEVYTYTDPRDGNEYRYREFYYMDGNNKVSAGQWMLENLRYIPDNTDTGFTGFTHTAANAPNTYTDKYWAYPWKGPNGNGSGTYNAVQAQADWDSHMGILYNWVAATNGRVTIAHPREGQGEANEADAIGVQGICPVGWHMPTDKEWNGLEHAIYNNASQYSQYKDDGSDAFTPTTWQSEWETGSVTLPGYGSRGSSSTKGHGLVMLAECPLPGSTYSGKSLSTAQGGFEVFLVGLAMFDVISNYGSDSGIWSASAYSASSGYVRYISQQNPGVRRGSASRSYFLSVRCVRDMAN